MKGEKQHANFALAGRYSDSAHHSRYAVALMRDDVGLTH
jgi:hypothetical protein